MDKNINIGTQLHAAHGYRALEKGTTYYFLKSSRDGLVHLIDFVVRQAKKVKKKFKSLAGTPVVREVSATPTPIPRLTVMTREDFEEGLAECPRQKLSAISKAAIQATLPPWLQGLSDLDLAVVDLHRHSAKRSHSDRIDRQLDVVHPLVSKLGVILASEDPDRLINEHARACQPKQNETRTRLTFYVYVLFGQNRFALHYPIQAIGRWSRATHPSTVKRGAPSKERGKGSGHNTSPAMVERIVEFYTRESRPGRELKTIHRDFLASLGCREQAGKNGMKRYMHPKGEPFPLFGTFRYHVIENVSQRNVERTLIGRVRMRSRVSAQKGPFSQGSCNVYEFVERDAYAVSDLPRGLLEGHVLPALYCARGRDTASGEILGIGFSQGAERGSAYRMELFCRAICKVRFCALFGIKIAQRQWVSQGVAMHDVQDRGPGSSDKATSRDKEFQPVISEITPTRSPQSKANIESSNPKTRKHDDAPEHFKSDKRTFELVRREIYRVLKDNESINIGARIPPELLDKVRKPCPNALYAELARLGRSDAMQMTFDEAVRAYLTRLQAKVTRSGILLHSQLFNSQALRDTGVLNRRQSAQSPSVEVYVLDACLRHIWLDVNGALIELDVVHPLRAGNEIIYMSLEELRERELFMKSRDREFGEHREATAAGYERQFEEDTGKKWRGGSRAAGRPRRGSKAAKQEAAEADGAMRSQ